MNIDQMRDILAHNIVNVRFYKMDGTKREMRCTTNFAHIPNKFQPFSDDSSYSNDQIRVFDLDLQEWRSFLFGRVISFEIEKSETPAEYLFGDKVWIEATVTSNYNNGNSIDIEYPDGVGEWAVNLKYVKKHIPAEVIIKIGDKVMPINDTTVGTVIAIDGDDYWINFTDINYKATYPRSQIRLAR